MALSRFSLSRRTMLRGAVGGAAVRVAVPVLEAMLNSHGTAFANGTTFPKRFGVYAWGCGIVHEAWVPTEVGTMWTAPFSLQPLATPALKPYVTVVTGYSHKGSSPGHIPARGIAFSSSHDLTRGIGGVGTYRGQFHPEPSVDQLVAAAWKGQTKFDWLGINIARKGPYSGNSSWLRGGSSAGFLTRVSDVYQRFFGMPLPPMGGGTNANAYQQSVLDAVKADGAALAKRLGAEDRLRMEQHLEGVRAIERRLVAPQTACMAPNMPSNMGYGEGSDRELKLEKTAVMAELLAYALACDLTRTFCFEFSGTQSEANYWECGANFPHHTNTHPRSALLRDILKVQMTGLATVAEALRKRAEGAGTVLDNTLIFGTSEHANPTAHDHNNHPLLFVGKAQGRFRAGVHFKHPGGSNADAPRVLLTAVHAMGVTPQTLGQTGGEGRQVNSVVPELLI